MNNFSLGKVCRALRRHLSSQYLYLKMKTTLFLIFVMVAAVQANSLAQRVSVSASQMKMEDFFSEISRQTKHRFFYSSEVARAVGNVQVDLRDASFEDALKSVLDPAKFEFKVIAGTVTINLKEENGQKKTVVTGHAQNRVTGTIRNREGEPLIGASVSIKGTSRAVQTDVNGTFSITADGDAILEVRYVGYQVKEIAVDNQQIVAIVLDADKRALESVEVVATGYQTLNQKFFTGSAQGLRAEDIKRDGVPDISRMLEGQAAGVSVQNVSGTFGAAPKIRIRGATSLSGDNKPLWVVDGIILEDVVNISNEALSTGDASTLIGSSVAGLNPDDIESFNILRDAAATALYGARAMNGVIIVTTKKGRNTEGTPNFSFSNNLTTFLKPSYRTYDILNSADQMAFMIELENKGYFNHSQISRARNGGVFYKMYNQMYEYDEASDSFALRNDFESRVNFLNRYANANTNWFDLLFKNSLMQEHSLSVTSGTAKSQIYASTSFLQDHGWTVVDNVKRFTGNIRGNFNVNDKLSIELLTNVSVRDQKTPGANSRDTDAVTGRYSRDFDINPFSYALNTSRMLTAYDENGNREFFVRDWAPFNILHELENNNMRLTMLDLKIQGGLKYKLFDDLTYSFDGAYRYAKSDAEHMVTEFSNMANAYRAMGDATIINDNDFLYDNPDSPNMFPVSVLPQGGFYNVNSDGITNYYMRNTVEYDKEIDENHSLNVFASTELRYTDRQNRTMEGVGYQYDRGGVPVIDPNMIKWRTEEGQYYYGMEYNYDRFIAHMARVAYSYKGKYNVNATGRYDGSNLMGDEPTARWLPTWNISGAWHLDEEDFFPADQNILSSASIRGTYGLVGSLGAANNSSVVFYNRPSRRPFLSDVETALLIDGLKNDELTWEKLYETNLGFDLGFANNRYTLSLDLYKREIFDLIGAFRTSGIGGQFTKMANYGDMEGKGVDATVSASIFRGGDFTWMTRLNLGYNQNEITNLDSRPNLWTLIRQDGGALVGGPQRGLYSIKYQGLIPGFGIPYFINENGEESMNVYFQNTTGVDNLVYHGPIDPTLTGGLYNQFSYKNFSLSFLLTFAAGNHIRLDPNFNIRPSDLSAATYDYLRRYYGEYPMFDTNIPGMIDGVSENQEISGYPYNAFNYSDQRVAKGDFIRFKQFSVGYQLPRTWAEAARLKSASLSLVGNNIWLMYSDSRLNGQDPEFFGAGGVAMPIPSQFTLNLKVGF